VEDLQASLESPSGGVAVMYLNHKETDTQSQSNLLAGLWRQLVLGKPMSVDACRLYARHREQRTRPSLDEMHGVLHTVISQYSRVFIVVDALDEYPEEHRNILLGCLSTLGPTVNLMLTSRPHINIENAFANSNLEIMEVRAREHDIRRHIDGQIVKSSRLSRHIKNSPNLREEIVTTILRRSDGM
jgi:hypothetical protein